MPWTWGDGQTEKPSGPYHLVWPRDLYQVATAQIAAGDREAAGRLLEFLFARAQKRDGSFPQNAEVDGTEHWDKVQMDQAAFPLVLAWQLGRGDAKTWTDHVQPAADFIVRTGPKSEQERWENQEGFSPGTIAAEIAGLVCAADIARRNGDLASAARYERTADAWQANVERWTATSNGPYSPKPYYLRVTKKRDPNHGTRYGIGDTGPRDADQRTVVDPSFLELVRLGVKRHDDPTILNSLAVVDDKLAVDLPGGRLWHRFSFDGYGETAKGAPWFIEDQEKPQRAQAKTFGRAWPIFAGERGEYELLAGRSATAQLATMASAAGPGLMLPEQVWDGRAPSGKPGFRAGKGTRSATPLAWTHAQFIRLAWSIDAGTPVERPSVVACRYAGC
jgi:glucoamylase